MAETSTQTDRCRRIGSIAFSIVVPIVLFSAFILASRTAVRSLYGPGDFPALFICTLAGTLPIFRSGFPVLAKIDFSLIYVLIFGVLLGLFGFAVDCSVFHDCD